MANEFIVKNGFKSQGDSEVTGSFTATSGMSGSFSGSFQGDGSSLSNVSLPDGVVSGSAQISYTGITDVPSGIISSSAQIASDISGSFGAASASFSTRVTTNETNISTLTAATASYILASQTSSMSVLSSSFAVSASYAPSADAFPFVGDAVITGSLIVSGSNLTSGFRTDTRNVILGYGAGNNQDASNGPFNVMIGYESGYTNTIGDSNVCIGQYAGYALSTNASDENIFIGKLAGAGGTSPVARMSDANWNIALGNESLLFLTSGDYNIGFGHRVMRNISTGQQNIGLGRNAIYNVNSGDNNIGIGYNAGFNQTTGDGNITIGSGSLGVAGESNQLRIGNGDTITTISASLETGDIIFPSTASATYFVGDGSNVTGVISASYAVTASHALNTTAFPFSGSAVITGSLIVTGSAAGGGDIDTTAAALYDDSGNVSIAYGTRALNATSGPKSIDYENRFLFDSANVQSIDYDNRLLKDRNGNTVADFFALVGNTYFSGSLIGTASYADNATSASYSVTASHALNAGGTPAINITANGTTLTEVTSDSDLPDTLAANTTYLIRGNIYTGRTLNVTNAGSSVIGVGRNQSHLSYTGSNELFNVHDASFSIRSLTMKSSGSIMTAKNVSPGAAYNDGRTKVLDIKDCQVKNTNNVMEVHGFELVDVNNVLFWYITGSQGLSFQSVRHLEISSCEFYNWYDETDTGSFAPAGTKMVEIRPNTGSVNTPVVNINSSIFHPEQSQVGLYIDSGSETLFGTVASNTFIDVNGGQLLGGSTYDSSSMLKYDVGLNQGLEDSKAYLYGYQSGTDALGATTTYTQINVGTFVSDIETRMSASTDGVTYIGTKPIDVMFQVNAGVADVGANNEQFDFALYKNTNIINGSERRIELDSGEEGLVTCFALTNIVQNDKLTVYYKSPSNDNFTLQNFAIMIKE